MTTGKSSKPVFVTEPAGEAQLTECRLPRDPGWVVGSFYDDSRRIVLDARAGEVWPAVSSIGGENGYYYADWLWQIRGIMDRLCGGVGLSRGRRSQTELYPGEALDFWRVVDVRRADYLLLSAEMKLPGEAVLSFRIKSLENGQVELQQVARFLPRGLLGHLYWYSVMPFHHYVFNGMLKGIAKASGKTIRLGPEGFKTVGDQ